MIRTLVVALLLLTASFCESAESPSNAIAFEVPVVRELTRRIDILTVPAYAVLALENIGSVISLSSHPVIKNREGFQIKAGSVKFVGKKGATYAYEAGMRLSMAGADTDLTIPIDIDSSSISMGVLHVKAYFPGAKLIPQELMDRIDFKIRTVADIQTQRKLIAYLDQVADEQNAKGRGFEGQLEAIAFDAYNRSGASMGQNGAAGVADKGHAESTKDQAMLLVTLAIWLVGFPVFLYIVRKQRKNIKSH